MSLDFQLIKYVDDKTDKLITGYLNEINGLIDKEYIIPSLVIKICLLFYFVREYFDKITNGKKGDAIILSNDKRTATLIDGGYAACFGNILIDSMSGIIHKWSVQMDGKNNSSRNLSVGIGTKDAEISPMLSSTDIYLYTCNGRGHTIPAGLAGLKNFWMDGDILDITLNLGERSLAFHNLTDQSPFLVMKDINVGKDVQYKFVAEFGTNGQKMTFLK